MSKVDEKSLNEDTIKYPMKKNPEYIETKSKRIQLLIQPSLHAQLKKRACCKETSVNNLIHIILESYFYDE